MILTGENWRTQRKTCPSANLSTTYPTRGLPWAWTWASAVRSQWLNTWTIAHPSDLVKLHWLFSPTYSQSNLHYVTELSHLVAMNYEAFNVMMKLLLLQSPETQRMQKLLLNWCSLQYSAVKELYTNNSALTNNTHSGKKPPIRTQRGRILVEQL
jgi:hypothetical protein